MATTSKYFVITPGADNLDLLDFNLNYGDVTTEGESIQYNGSSKIDSIFVRPGLTYDLSNTAAGADKIYFTGNFGDYARTFDSQHQTLKLSRTVNGLNEAVTVSSGTPLAFDNLIFSNGSVNANALFTAVSTASALPVPSSAETSLAPQGAAATGATLNANIKAFSTNTAAAGQVGETFASTKPGISLTINGSNGIDTVYVTDGEVVDATVTGASVDLIYMRGNWADYTKTVFADKTKVEFTRTINGHVESVKVAFGTPNNYDRLVFADGTITTIKAKELLIVDPTSPGPVDPILVTPLVSKEEVLAAIKTIRDAAEANNASATVTPVQVFKTAGIIGVDANNLSSINSALNSLPIDGNAADTAPEIQAIVSAYRAILASADGVDTATSPSPDTPLTGAQYTKVGVTGVSGISAAGNLLHLLDSVVDLSTNAKVDTVPELQAMAAAAGRVLQAAGGTLADSQALTLTDLSTLGIAGVDGNTLATVQAAIRAVAQDSLIDTQPELQALVNTKLGAAGTALNLIAAAAEADSATAGTPDLATYITAGVTDVTGMSAATLASINTALDSKRINGALANTAPKVQAIVDAYKAILASADGNTTANTATALTADQYNAIGVTGVSGTSAAGNAMFLLDDVVDLSLTSAVDTETEVQSMADAATHVIAAAGGSAAQAAAVTVDDLAALGITNVAQGNMTAIQAAIRAVSQDNLIDTKSELQAIVNGGVTGINTALGIITLAAERNTAGPAVTPATVYAAANVSGVDSSNVDSINSALNSGPINGAAADSVTKVQDIVNAYNAILASADGFDTTTRPTPDTPLTGNQFTNVGVVGLSGQMSADGNVMHLLDSVVDLSIIPAVDTVPELQAMVDAAGRVLQAAGGTLADSQALTLTDLIALGIAGVDGNTLATVQATIRAVAQDSLVDTQPELQALVNTKLGIAGAALNLIAKAAEDNIATDTTPDLTTYINAGVPDVAGMSAATLASINTALNSKLINGALANTAPKVQAIVEAYQAILASADGNTTTANTIPALTGAQYNAIGVTGVSGTAAAGNAVFLLDDVVDRSLNNAVDTEAEVQAMASAATHVIAAAGGSALQAVAVTAMDLTNLGITNVADGNMTAIRGAIRAVSQDSLVDTQAELQAIVNAGVVGISTALDTLAAAAEANNASATLTSAAVYAAANVSGVDSSNLASINSALNSKPINGLAADTTPEVQAIVDAYATILAEANGAVANPNPLLSSTPYTSVGVTGISGTAAAGNILFLLDDVVNHSTAGAVDSVPELQAMVDGAAKVLQAAGGTLADALALSVADLTALGITNVGDGNITAIRASIHAVSQDNLIDTKSELQGIVDTSILGITTALDRIAAAADANDADAIKVPVTLYVAASVSGVDDTNLASINSALNSGPIDRTAADSVLEVQGIVDAYTAILAEANGATPNTGTPLTGMQYTSVGVTGVSGIAAAGNALFLLDDVVDNSAAGAVDTVPELQAMANAAAHVIAAAGGTATQAAVVTVDDLTALGITGVNADNLADVRAAIQATTPDSLIDTRSELRGIVALAGNVHPVLTCTLGGVNNLDVTSNIVLGSNQTVTVGAGMIHFNDMGGTGYQGDTSTNSQNIEVRAAVASGLLTITGTGASTKIIINPQWDLDLASNYQVTIDDGAFVDASGTHAAAHFAPITFGTVTPGTHVAGAAATEAAASRTMVDATGALTASKGWLDIQGIGNNTGSVTQLGDLSGGAYALVMKNYATAPGGAKDMGGNDTDGIATHDTNVGVTNFGNNDIVYFDSQVNNSISQAGNPIAQFFDARYTSMTDGFSVGGLAGQNALVMGLVSTPQQQGSTAMILLGLEGNTGNKIYPSIVTQNATTIGWANDWHATSAPVIMG